MILRSLLIVASSWDRNTQKELTLGTTQKEDIPQKRLIILRSLLIVGTPYYTLYEPHTWHILWISAHFMKRQMVTQMSRQTTIIIKTQVETRINTPVDRYAKSLLSRQIMLRTHTHTHTHTHIFIHIYILVRRDSGVVMCHVTDIWTDWQIGQIAAL